MSYAEQKEDRLLELILEDMQELVHPSRLHVPHTRCRTLLRSSVPLRNSLDILSGSEPASSCS